MENQQLVEKMLEMQRALDNDIYTKKNVEFDETKCKLALLDELGEFNHENKSTWCWWKDTQPEVDKAKQLEEFADCMHFALSLCYHWHDEREETFELTLANREAIEKEASPHMLFIRVMIATGYSVVECLIELGWKYGIELEDVYKAYVEKNQENYRRLESGY